MHDALAGTKIKLLIPKHLDICLLMFGPSYQSLVSHYLLSRNTTAGYNATANVELRI